MSGIAPRPGILDITPYVGGESRVAGVSRVIKLASNESALGPSPRAVDAIRAAAAEVHRYPDGGCEGLREALGRRFALDPARIVCGAGSDELIGLLARSYCGPGDEVLYTEHGFLMYPIAARTAGATPVAVPERNLRADVDALTAAVTDRTRILFLANPNNPTGTFFSRDRLCAFLDQVSPETLVVLDEAYFEYVDAPDYPNGLSLLARYPNLLVLRTFSKIYGLAGIRVGYGVGAPELIDILNRVKLPFNANALGQEAAVAALDDAEFVARSLQVNREGLRHLHEYFSGADIPYVPSVANFIMVLLPVPGEELFDKMQRRGVLVRPLRGFGVPEAIRVTVGRAEENARFISVFEEAMRELGCLRR